MLSTPRGSGFLPRSRVVVKSDRERLPATLHVEEAARSPMVIVREDRDREEYCQELLDVNGPKCDRLQFKPPYRRSRPPNPLWKSGHGFLRVHCAIRP